MNKLSIALMVVLIVATQVAEAKGECDKVIDVKLPDVAFDSAVEVATPSPHCKVKGKIGGEIGFSLWLPDGWNGRFAMGGAGGFVGPEDNQAMTFDPQLLAKGFATASSDTGHRGTGVGGSWALNDYEAIVNYGHLGMHRTVTTAKAVIAEYYGKASDKSFFVGCSNGGRQALHEAQRYPHDFDGIVAGAPALSFTGVTANFVSITQKMFPDPTQLQNSLVTLESRRFLRQAILKACDAADGQVDGILNDPTTCDFDPESLRCGVDQSDQCIPGAQLDAINIVYDGPYDKNGQIFFGFPFGAEDVGPNGWGSWLTGGSASGPPNAAYGFGLGVMRYFVHQDADWDYRGYDWNDFRDDLVPIGQVLDANSPDLTEFRAHGGKLLMFHGWSDVALTARMSTDYVNRVYAQDDSAKDDVRLFMMPGVLHCFGGQGPSVVGWLDQIESWHDSDIAPTQISAAYPSKVGNRKLCAWPQQAVFTGGESESADSYVCK
jgi:hypothetical protein